MEKRVGLKFKNKRFLLKVKVCNWFWMFKGLMFARREKAQALLLFNFSKPKRWKIHSFFVFFPFVAVWLDEGNRVIEKRVVKPFTPVVFPKKSFTKLIEIPINKKYSAIIDSLVGDD